MPATLRSMFESLQVRNFRLLFTGQITKVVGTYMQFTAQDWLVLTLSHNSPYALGVVSALQFAPVLVLMLYAGKLADRYDKRHLLIIVNAAFSGLALAMGLLVVTHSVTLHWVFLLAALMGTVQAVDMPVRQAMLAELVEPAFLPNAIALKSAAYNTGWVFGPALAGGAIALVGTGQVFLLNVLTCLGALVSILRMRPAQMYRETGAGRPSARIRDGLRYVWRRGDLIVPLILIFVSELLAFQTAITIPTLAKNVFGAGPGAFGLLTTSLGVGGLLGALASTIRRSRPSVYLVLGAAAAYAAMEIAAAFGPTFWLTALLLVPTGFFTLYFIQACNQRIQLGVTPEHRGRTSALYYLVLSGTTPFGALLAGWLAERYGPRTGLWSGGLLTAGAAASVLLWQLRHSGDRLAMHLRPWPHIHIVEPEASGLVRQPS